MSSTLYSTGESSTYLELLDKDLPSAISYYTTVLILSRSFSSTSSDKFQAEK